MATTEITAAASATTRPRQLLVISTQLMSDGYDDWEREVRHGTRLLGAATLVSSELGDGTHAPALDLDFPATLAVDDAGALTLWVDAPLRRWRFTRFTRRGLAAGLLRRTDAGLDLPQRQAGYTAARDRVLDTAAQTAVLRRAGASLGSTLEEALATAWVVCGDGPDRPVTQGPPMANPWPLPLAVPAELVGSSHHQHLYLDAALPWATYRRLLRAARRAGLLEAGYVRVSAGRTGTHLRLPWVHKQAPDAGE